jgi:uncharacterized delta-60 repeat protein
VKTPIGSDADSGNAAAIDSQGRIVVAGQSVIGNDDFALARYNPNGSLDTSFNGTGKVTTPIGVGFDQALAVTIDPQGRIVAAGSSFNGANNDFALVRYNPDGGLDTSFNGTGKVTRDLFSANDNAAAVAVDAQGRIVAAGTSRVGGDDDFAVARFDASGNVDNSFSSDGKATVDFTPVAADQDVAKAMAIDGQGRIVLAGETTQPSAGTDFALARLNSDGSRDATFGTNAAPSQGEVTTPIGSGIDSANAVAVDPQGRIIAVGSASVGTNDDFALARYNPNGSLDTSFGGTGKVTTPIAPAENFASAVTIDAQGRIIAAGRSFNGSNYDFALVRYHPDGSLDTSFNGTGMVTVDIVGFNDVANAVAIDPQGKIVAAGYDLQGDNDFAVARLNDNGTPDTTFGPDHNGEVRVDFTPSGSDDDQASAVAIDSQGRIVLAGKTDANTAGTYDFALARLNSDGSRDATFGTNAAPSQGEVTTPIGSGDDSASAVTIDAQGRIIAAGSSYNGADNDFALARYNPNGSLDTSFNGTGKVTTAVSSNDPDYGNAAAIDSQGRIVVAGTSDSVFALARYNPNGSLDTSFNGSGNVVTPIGSAGNQANAVVIDAQDRIVAAGYAQGATNNDFALARYIGDQTPPGAPSIESGPANGSYTNDPTPTFAFSSSEAAATFSCGLDGLSSSCGSPFTPAAALGDGAHSFSLTGTDKAGNTSAPTIRRFTVDTHKPELKIKGKGKVKTAGRKGRDKLKLKSNEPTTFKCKVDRKKAKSCKAKYKTPKLKLGKHKLKVTATDRAGNRVSKTKKLKVVRKR